MNSAISASWNLPFFIASNHGSLHSQITLKDREKILACWQSLPPSPTPSPFSLFVHQTLHQTLVCESGSLAGSRGDCESEPLSSIKPAISGLDLHTLWLGPTTHLCPVSPQWKGRVARVLEKIPENRRECAASFIPRWRNTFRKQVNGSCCFAMPVTKVVSQLQSSPFSLGVSCPQGSGGVVVWAPCSPKACHPTIPRLPPVTSDRVARRIRASFPQENSLHMRNPGTRVFY